MRLAETIRELQAEVAYLKEELARHEERTEGLNAEQMQNRAVEYVQMNPIVWERIKQDALNAAGQHKRFSIAKEFEELRNVKWLDLNENEQYKCNNSYRAPLTRMLVQEIPEVRPYVSMRRSKVDKYYQGVC